MTTYKTSERLPTAADANKYGRVSAFDSTLDDWFSHRWSNVAASPKEYTHWRPQDPPPLSPEVFER